MVRILSDDDVATAIDLEALLPVVADVPAEAVETGDLRPHVELELEVHPFGVVLEDEVGRQSADEILVLESVGTAVLDAASAEFVFDRAVEREAGTTVSLE